MADVRLVDRPETFHALLDEVRGAPLVALDTEAASFHRFHDRIYLVQLSTRTLTAVIDPLGVGDLTPIGDLLADPAIEVIFHDADYDLRLFDKQFSFRASHLFDTRIAAQFLNEPGIGLGALLAKYFNVTADKRFQRADWSARPLSAPMLDYAAGDTVHLCELRDILLEQLDAMGRTEWVAEEFENLEKIRWTGGGEGPETAFLRLKGAKALQRRELAILRELYNWREETSARLDRASFRVLGNEVLFALAQQPVHTLEELGRVKGVGQEGAQRRGNEILAAIAKGEAIPERDLPRVERPARRIPDPAFEARVEALKHRRNRLAEELQLAPGVLCPNGTLEAIARAEPASLDALATIPELRRWQVKVLGPSLLQAVAASG
ncbi:MAG: ribonuclease D [Gemmatimonadetes bacterium]|nr:ribonuclease D [Gemmatimonadota bacterium]MBL0178735.1 ribonuclease D [Gemmatimonadota bacterium]